MAVFAFALPSSALAAGTYTWNLSTDFANDPGSNPGADAYGADPWSYVQGDTSTGRFSALPVFVPGSPGNLSEWSTDSSGDPPVVGINETGSPVINSLGVIQPGQVVVEPGAREAVAVGWTSPLSQTQPVTISGTVAPAAGPQPMCDTAWSVVDQNGDVIDPGGFTGTGNTISDSVAVAPGSTVYVAVSPILATNSACAAVLLSLSISASGTPPTVNMSPPLIPGFSGSLNQPTFGGSASTAFGDSSQITVSIYDGNAASGNPVQTIMTTRSGPGWFATAATLPFGTYTAVAEQDDLAYPPDQSYTAGVTFDVRPILGSLGSRPLSTSTPTLTGTGGIDPSDLGLVIDVYSGSTAGGTPIRTLTPSLGPSGQFSAQVTPALPDGTYTATAAQANSAGITGVSVPQTFGIDTQPPAVTLISPGVGARDDALQLAFNGDAGTRTFDSGVVTVWLYKGRATAGAPVRKLRVPVRGSRWATNWSGTLQPGLYTAQATQSDVLGHVGLSASHTFRVVPLPPVVGAGTFTRAGSVNLKVACNEPPGDTCSGTILVVTTQSFQPVAGGPAGPLTVMFASVRIPGGGNPTVTRALLPGVVSALRHRAAVPVTVIVNLRPRRGKAVHAQVRAVLRRR